MPGLSPDPGEVWVLAGFALEELTSLSDMAWDSGSSVGPAWGQSIDDEMSRVLWRHLRNRPGLYGEPGQARSGDHTASPRASRDHQAFCPEGN